MKLILIEISIICLLSISFELNLKRKRVLKNKDDCLKIIINNQESVYCKEDLTNNGLEDKLPGIKLGMVAKNTARTAKDAKAGYDFFKKFLNNNQEVKFEIIHKKPELKERPEGSKKIGNDYYLDFFIYLHKYQNQNLFPRPTEIYINPSLDGCKFELKFVSAPYPSLNFNSTKEEFEEAGILSEPKDSFIKNSLCLNLDKIEITYKDALTTSWLFITYKRGEEYDSYNILMKGAIKSNVEQHKSSNEKAKELIKEMKNAGIKIIDSDTNEELSDEYLN